MSEAWTSMIAREVKPGDRVRLASGVELIATRIEPNFFGMPMVAFIEDTPSRWFKQPVSEDTEVEVLREG
jgi:hypothetical protein